MHCQDLVDRLDDELRTDDYADLDASANGLQVGPADHEVTTAAFAVDAAVETIERAANVGADLLVTHHGLSWGGIERITGREYERISRLVDHDIALYTSHLPLDGHQDLGNAAGVADLLGLEERVPFGSLGPEYIGQRGQTPEPRPIAAIRETLQTLDTGGQDVQLLDFGPETVRDVAVVTGSGVDWLDEALDCGADVLVTGEGKQQVYHDAREAGIHVVLAGHYATETFGVRSLATLVGEWGPETTLISCPTGL
ncbi:dinuclear metal center protein, YbgI/SA1388 family [Halovenus aranensis]|uniref:Dinuclear metal center protein, YbgI/SA1388 family n=1 Tax=Halovenus aranensis TaxID=890420 RepID=A0A1G8SQQ8_9EURY|nr:Nif3-like dinuclear metal center hexameric protein [Halovenus aranensis]SDJ30950.1 dinuclear metal center protein, YbgI/SA1388 family [Halovenus aranensis]